MTKRYTILRRKLEQLEAIIARVSTLPTDQTQCHQLLSETEGIEQRFDFLKNLLSTEMASHPSKQPPHHLLHIDRKLNQLESTFRQWDDYRKSIINYDYNNDDDDDDDSVCSCKDSGEVLAVSGFRDDFGLSNSTTTVKYYDHDDQVAAENFYDAVAPPVDDLIKGKKRRNVWKRRYCAVMVVGVILVINFSSHFHDTDHHEGFLTPT